MTYAYNSSYLGGRDQEDQGQPGQKVSETSSQTIKFRHGGVCLSSQFHGKHRLEDSSTSWHGLKYKTLIKKIIITKAKKGWWHGLSGRVPA
jgi:hypothetical protein